MGCGRSGDIGVPGMVRFESPDADLGLRGGPPFRSEKLEFRRLRLRSGLFAGMGGLGRAVEEVRRMGAGVGVSRMRLGDLRLTRGDCEAYGWDPDIGDANGDCLFSLGSGRGEAGFEGYIELSLRLDARDDPLVLVRESRLVLANTSPSATAFDALRAGLIGGVHETGTS